MDDNIQVYRGPMEVEGPDDFDDDLQYIKESNERRSLKNRDQDKNKNNKNSLLLYGILFMVLGGMIFFNLIIDQEDEQIEEDESYQPITKTLLGCPRTQYFNLTSCLKCPEQCEYCEEITGQCLQCSKTYFIDAKGECIKECPKDHQKGQLCIDTLIDVNGIGGIFRSQQDNETEIEIPYMILSQKNINKTIYVFQQGFIDNIGKYIDHVDQANFVIVDDYDLLTDKAIRTVVQQQFIPYIQGQLLNKEGEIILIAEGEKSHLLLHYLSTATNKYKLAALINPQIFNTENHKIFQNTKLQYPYQEVNIDALLIYNYLQPILIIYQKIEDLPQSYKQQCQQQQNRLLAEGDFLDKDKQEESKDKQEESKDKQEESKDKQEESKDKQEESKDNQEESKDKQEESKDKNQEIKSNFKCLAMDEHYLQQIIEFKNKL